MMRTKSIRLPSLPSLRAFEAVARLASVKEAADEMKLTASAVSHQLRNLENHLGVALFRRRNQSIELTEAGALFATYTERAFHELRQGVAALRSDSDQTALHVSVAPLFAMEVLIPALPDFERAHPGVQLRLDVGETLTDFDSELIDVAIRFGPTQSSGLFSESLLDVCLAPVCAPRLLTGRNALRSPADLQSHALLVTDDTSDHGSWELWLAATGYSAFKPASRLRFDSFLGTVQAAEAGLGVVIAPLQILARHLADGRLVAPFTASVQSPWPYRLVCRRGQLQQPKIDSFRRWVSERCRSHAKLANLPCTNRAKELYSQLQESAIIA
jgi:LysR family transcriptional regulator, glycine cleavage system transcriptional activator